MWVLGSKSPGTARSPGRGVGRGRGRGIKEKGKREKGKRKGPRRSAGRTFADGLVGPQLVAALAVPVHLAVVPQHPRGRLEVLLDGVQVVGQALAACKAPSEPRPRRGTGTRDAGEPLTFGVLLLEALVAVLDVQVLQIAPHLLLVPEIDQPGHAEGPPPAMAVTARPEVGPGPPPLAPLCAAAPCAAQMSSVNGR